MADISTGRQRGIVPFVDETTGRLPDQYLPQGVIDLQDDLEQAVTDAGASATAAKASADTATQSASAAAQSAESASGDATAAKASAGEAASSAGAAKASETAAASSATAAAGSEAAAKASETAAAQSAQTATEQVSSIGDSVEQAAASAAAAQQSATNAASSASNAGQSASSASSSASQAGESASQASGSASTASQAATTATGAASNASSSATAAQQSATEASASAQAAKASETNAASSASAAKVSETNAANSATAAQQAVDGFGLEVGTTTTGDPGADASVNITKQGTKYVADFTIPQGPKGDPGDLTTVTHDDTLTGDGTSGTPLSQAQGYIISKPIHQYEPPVDEVPYSVAAGRSDMPSGDYGPLINIKGYSDEDAALFFPHSSSNGIGMWLGSRIGGAWSKGGWHQIAFKDDVSGTIANPKSQEWNAIDFNDFTEDGVYTFNCVPTNGPRGDATSWITGELIVVHSHQHIMQLCSYFSAEDGPAGFSFRGGSSSDSSDIKWDAWHQIAFKDDVSGTSSLANEMSNIASLSTRVQALEARIKSLETNQ